MELIARRQFVPAYIALDTVFLLVLAGLLLWKKRRMAALVGGIMGVVYFIVDYGVFHLICHSRSIEGGSLFWTLLWMSMSYGFTNFAWIWLALDKDEYLIEWSLLILCWWFCCPMLAQLIGFGQMPIVIQRTTGAYHGWMAAILFVGYLLAVVRNLGESDRKCRIDLLRAAGHWHCGAVCLGGSAAARRHSQRRAGFCGKAPPADRQFAARNQSGHAVCLSHLRRPDAQVHAGARTAGGRSVVSGAHRGEQRKARPQTERLKTSFAEAIQSLCQRAGGEG